MLISNPFRAVVIDDDFAYARMVRGLSDGHYYTDDWVAANPIFPAFLGAALSKLFGFSFGLLIGLNLLLFVGAVCLFYKLRMYFSLDRTQSAIASACLLSCPLLPHLVMGFMTDVPFLSTILISLCLYQRAFRIRSAKSFLLASSASAACIFTRQFGAALPFGLVVTWFLSKRKMQDLKLYISGIILPAVATTVQVVIGFYYQNWGAKYALHNLQNHLGDFHRAIILLFWRIAVALNYWAVFFLPFADTVARILRSI